MTNWLCRHVQSFSENHKIYKACTITKFEYGLECKRPIEWIFWKIVESIDEGRWDVGLENSFVIQILHDLKA